MLTGSDSALSRSTPDPNLNTGVWAVIPVKAFSVGKSRLANALTVGERERFNRSLFLHTLSVVLQSLVDVALVVSSAPEVLLDADKLGAKVLMESDPEQGLNGALNQAAVFAKTYGAHGLLSLFADLPWIAHEDINALIDTQGTITDIAIAPDRHESGTNAIFQRPIGIVEFCYGENSFLRHCYGVRDAEVSVRIVRRRGLQFDIDTDRDLELLRSTERINAGYRNITCPCI